MKDVHQRPLKPRAFGLVGIVLIGVLFSTACSKGSKDSPPAAVSQGVEEVAPKVCIGDSELSAFGNHYARKDVWERLPSSKALYEAYGDFYLQAVEVTKSGVMGILGWHEWAEACVQRRDGEFWARLLNESDAEWEGPFIAVEAKAGFERAYFNRIFGESCYKTVDDEQWCFGDGTIQVGKRVLQAKLVLDPSEMPGYGLPVDIEGEPVGFWIFVPKQGAWHVFKDGFVTQEGRVDIDPEQSPPWRVLMPK